MTFDSTNGGRLGIVEPEVEVRDKQVVLDHYAYYTGYDDEAYLDAMIDYYSNYLMDDHMRARPPVNWSPYTSRTYLALTYQPGAIDGLELSYAFPIASAFIDETNNLIFIMLDSSAFGTTSITVTFTLSENVQGRMSANKHICNPDSTNWYDTSGYPCTNYAMDALCTADGGYGLAWNPEWGLFEHYATNDGFSGLNCPECGCTPSSDITRLQRSVNPVLDRIALCTGTFPDPPITEQTGGSSGSSDQCASVTSSVTMQNSWQCRACFRIRAYFQLSDHGILDFNSNDYMIVQFSAPVTFIDWAHPIETVEDLGGGTAWMLSFSSSAQFTERVMDWTANLLFSGESIPSIVGAQACGASSPVVYTTVFDTTSMTVPTTVPTVTTYANLYEISTTGT